jgi:pyroglutamyl-peptidase
VRTGLITGFGPFLDVQDNPSARLAAAVDGAALSCGARLVSVRLPVSYSRAADELLRAADRLKPLFILGIGVARGRTEPFVELRARPEADGTDVDGRCPDRLDDLDGSVDMGPFGRELAAALPVRTSEDAGIYVCNAWMRAAATRQTAPAAFLHIPADGIDPARLVAALDRVTLGW